MQSALPGRGDVVVLVRSLGTTLRGQEVGGLPRGQAHTGGYHGPSKEDIAGGMTWQTDPRKGKHNRLPRSRVVEAMTEVVAHTYVPETSFYTCPRCAARIDHRWGIVEHYLSKHPDSPDEVTVEDQRWRNLPNALQLRSPKVDGCPTCRLAKVQSHPDPWRAGPGREVLEHVRADYYVCKRCGESIGGERGIPIHYRIRHPEVETHGHWWWSTEEFEIRQ